MCNIYIELRTDAWAVVISRLLPFKRNKIWCVKFDRVMSALRENNGGAVEVCPAGVDLTSDRGLPVMNMALNECF